QGGLAGGEDRRADLHPLRPSHRHPLLPDRGRRLDDQRPAGADHRPLRQAVEHAVDDAGLGRRHRAGHLGAGAGEVRHLAARLRRRRQDLHRLRRHRRQPGGGAARLAARRPGRTPQRHAVERRRLPRPTPRGPVTDRDAPARHPARARHGRLTAPPHCDGTMTFTIRPQAAVAARIVLVGTLAFLVLGVPDGGDGVAWPFMRAALHQPLEALGLLSAAAVAMSAVSGRLTRRLGPAVLLVAACALCLVALLGIALSPAWATTVISFLVYGAGGGILDAVVQAQVVTRHGLRSMGAIHAGYGAGVTAGPLLMTGIITAGAGWRATPAWRCSTPCLPRRSRGHGARGPRGIARRSTAPPPARMPSGVSGCRARCCCSSWSPGWRPPPGCGRSPSSPARAVSAPRPRVSPWAPSSRCRRRAVSRWRSPAIASRRRRCCSPPASRCSAARR